MPLIHDQITSQTALTPASGFLAAMTHTLNPYVGCAFGCAFCYVQELPVARFSPRFRAGWGNWAQAKLNIGERLAHELNRHARRGRLDQLQIFMSSATDPYQPIERQHQLTRACLAAMAQRPPGWLVVQTRGPLVVRDSDLLASLGRRAMVSFTIETADEEVRRAVAPRTPSLARRLAAMRELRAAGIYVQAAVAPLLPGDPERLAALLGPVCDRVVVDSFVAGDGAGGRRTAQTAIPAIFAGRGWGDWRDPAHAARVTAVLAEQLGPERVLWSQAGFVTPPAGFGPGAAG